MEKENQLQPLGICRRIFNFLINDVIARGIKQVSLGSGFVKPNGEEMEPLQASGRSKYGPSSGNEAIKIHFKETEEQEYLENWSHIDHTKVGPLVHQENESQMIKHNKAPMSLPVTSPVKIPFTDEKARRKYHTRVRGKDQQGVEPNLSQARGLKRGVVLKDKGKNVVTEQLVEQPIGLPKVTRHPINVLAQNINERSESFINSRKAAMRSHLSMELNER